MFRIYRFFKNYNSFPIFLVCFKSVWKTYTYTVVQHRVLKGKLILSFI